MSSVALPPNLKLFDPKIVEPEIKPEFTLDDFRYPILNVPTHTDVKKFCNPGEVVTQIALEKTIFEVALRRDIILDAVRYTRHKRRQPKKTKRMSEIRGSNKKPRPQKGTGQSQVGHRRNSSWVGGQKAHGPVIRDYSISMNKKQRALAMMMALAAKFREGNLHIYDVLSPPTHRTKELVALLEGHGVAEKPTLFVDIELDENFARAVGNLPKAESCRLNQLNTYEVLKKAKLAMSAKCFSALQEQCLRQYLHRGKRGALNYDMEKYLEIVQQGRDMLAAAAQQEA
jgi:large subunit ribosomal protein L4